MDWLFLRNRATYCCTEKLFLTSDIASKQKSLLAQGQYGKAAALFLKHPYLLIFRLLRLRNRLYSNP
jgi:hypothetical protein